MKFITHLALMILVGCIFVPSPARAESVVFDKIIRTYQQEGFHGALWSYAFNGAQWLSDGSLAVTGNCNIRENYTGGLYLFDEDGTYEEKENSCHHTSNTRVACPEGGGCQMGWQVAQKGQYLIREGQAPSSVRRSPLVYRKSGTSLSYISRLFFTDINDDLRYPQGPMDEWEEWASYHHPVVVGDTLVVLKSGTGSVYSPSYNKLVGLSVPNLGVLWEEFPEGNIAGAIDDMLVLAQNNLVRPLTTTLIAYHVEDDGLVELNRVQMPGSVLGSTGSTNLKVDAQNPSIGAVAVTADYNASCTVVRLRKTNSGIEKIDERTFTLFAGDGGTGGGCGANFSISGDYIAFALGTNGMRVWKGTTEIVFSQPEELMFEPGSGLPPRFDGQALGIDVRDDGKIVLTMGNRVVLYSISGATTTPPTGGGGGDLAGMTVGELGRVFTQIVQSGSCSPTDPTDFGTPNPFFTCVLQRIISGDF